MGRLIYGMNVSLDGFINRPDQSLDWTIVDDELHTWFNNRARELDASIYGRRLYQLMNGYWPTSDTDPEATDAMREFGRIWNATPKIVFSSTLESVDPPSRLVRGDVGEELERIRAEFPGDIEIAGATVASAFIRRGLVDEYHLIVHPVAIGAGTRFFPELADTLRLRLLDQHTFTSGVTALRYETIRG